MDLALDLIDSHAHLDFPQFDADREEMLGRARQAGVGTILSIGIGEGPHQLRAALPFAEKHEWIYATIGIHPDAAHQATEAHFDEMRELARHAKVIAWGEIGLDYHYDEPPREVQQRVFRRQLELACEANLPVIIHCRDAWDDCLAILEEMWKPAGIGGILHCFSGTEQDAGRGLDMNFLVSFAGNLTYPKNDGLRQIAGALPLDRLLIETDSPFLAPQGRRGKRNEPAFVLEVARALASVRDLAVEEAAAATSANFRRLFGSATCVSPEESG
jgi:TatD DNase family protein